MLSQRQAKPLGARLFNLMAPRGRDEREEEEARRASSWESQVFVVRVSREANLQARPHLVVHSPSHAAVAVNSQTPDPNYTAATERRKEWRRLLDK